MTNPLAYVTTQIPSDGIFKISPSRFPTFIESVHNWYRTEVLKEEGFSHNTSSVIGTCVHYCAEKVAKEEEVNQKIIKEYIYSLEVHDEYIPEVVEANYVEMAERLVNDYVIDRDFLEIEKQFIFELKDKYYVGGKIDVLEGTKNDCMIVDYKTYHSKIKPKAITQSYKYQLLTYMYVLYKLGYNVTRIRLVMVNRNIVGEISEKTNKQMMSYPPEVTVLTETVTVEDFNFIEGLLHLCVDTQLATIAHPELTHVLWHDPRLKV